MLKIIINYLQKLLSWSPTKIIPMTSLRRKYNSKWMMISSMRSHRNQVLTQKKQRRLKRQTIKSQKFRVSTCKKIKIQLISQARYPPGKRLKRKQLLKTRSKKSQRLLLLSQRSRARLLMSPKFWRTIQRRSTSNTMIL